MMNSPNESNEMQHCLAFTPNHRDTCSIVHYNHNAVAVKILNTSWGFTDQKSK